MNLDDLTWYEVPGAGELLFDVTDVDDLDGFIRILKSEFAFDRVDYEETPADDETAESEWLILVAAKRRVSA